MKSRLLNLTFSKWEAITKNSAKCREYFGKEIESGNSDSCPTVVLPCPVSVSTIRFHYQSFWSFSSYAAAYWIGAEQNHITNWSQWEKETKKKRRRRVMGLFSRCFWWNLDDVFSHSEWFDRHFKKGKGIPLTKFLLQAPGGNVFHIRTLWGISSNTFNAIPIAFHKLHLPLLQLSHLHNFQFLTNPNCDMVFLNGVITFFSKENLVGGVSRKRLK